MAKQQKTAVQRALELEKKMKSEGKTQLTAQDASAPKRTTSRKTAVSAISVKKIPKDEYQAKNYSTAKIRKPLYNKLKWEADKRGTSPGKLCNAIIEDWLNNNA